MGENKITGSLSSAATPKKAASDGVAKASAPSPAHHAQKRPGARHFVLIALCSFGLLLAMWSIGTLSEGKIRIGTIVVPERYSNAHLRQLVTQAANNYQLAIAVPSNQPAYFSLADLGLQVDAGATVNAIRTNERSGLHALTWWRPVATKLVFRTHSAVLQAFITNHLHVPLETSQDASLQIVKGSARITPAKNGTEYGLANPNLAIRQAAASLRTAPVMLEKMARAATVPTSALVPYQTQLAAILGQPVAISVGDQTLSPAAEDIAQWLTLTSQNTAVKIAVQHDGIDAYLQNMAGTYNHEAQSEIQLDTTGQVLRAGKKGVAVGDSSGAARDIASGLLAAKGIRTSVPVASTNFQVIQAPTAGKWIEVNVYTKRMYAYDQGQLVRTFLVSAGAPATPTVIGKYAIYAKYTSQDMHGFNADGSTYFQPAVPYVNYFYQDYSIHGNYWRPASYFGNINSSHGCVGLTVSDSQWVYDWAPVGTPVITHT